VLKNRKSLVSLAKIITAVAFICLCAQISFGLPGGIPFSGQSLAVLAVAISMGFRSGTIAVAIYLILGALGLPVLAGGSYGYEHFYSPFAGYLFGFLISAAVVGKLKEKGFDQSYFKNFIAFIIGHAIILALGTFVVYLLRDWETAWIYGLKPFLIPAVIKSLLGGLIMPIYYQTKADW
jgi:biotin transport system substrate-specific component